MLSLLAVAAIWFSKTTSWPKIYYLLLIRSPILFRHGKVDLLDPKHFFGKTKN